jgi:hypothetical protein
MQECSKNNNMKGLTKETAEALKFTAQSTAECIQFLLQDLGFYYILTRTFSSDAIESMFSDVRLKGGSQDGTDAEAAENAIKRILQCGLIKTSLSANVFSECDYSSNIELIVYNCFPPAAYVGYFPFFVPLFVLVQHFPSIFFSPLHQPLPLCIFHLVFCFSFSTPFSSSRFLAPLSPILPLKSPPTSMHSSLSFFIVFSTRLVVVLISLLYTVNIFHHSLPIWTFLSLIIPPVAHPFFFSLFAHGISTCSLFW